MNKKNGDEASKMKKKRSKVLLVLTTIYTSLYVILILSFIIFEDYNLEITFKGIGIGLTVIIFLIGYYYSWKNEMVAGIIFIFWWGIMWYIGLFVAETDRGVGVVMGFPMFIIGILFIIFRFKRRSSANSG